MVCLASALVLAHCEGTSSDVPVYDGELPGGGDGGASGGDGGSRSDAGTGIGTHPGDDGGDRPGDDGGSIGAPLTGNGCAGGLCQNPTCQPYGTPADPGATPETGFDAQPSFIPHDTIIPTFDDVPDGESSPTDPVYGVGSWTKGDIDWLNANNLKMDFFINTNNWCGDVTQDADCTATIVSLLQTQNAANHTVHHVHLGLASTTPDPPDGCATAAACEAEITGVESLVNTLSRGGMPHLTRFRAPFGEPYQAQGTGLGMVAPVVAKYGVEVDWNLDSGDSTCESTTAPCFTGQDIARNVEQLVGAAPGQGQRWGILLMHGVFPWTRDAVPLLFGPNGYLTKHGFKLATVEDAICWKYGKHSWEIVQKISGQARSPN